MLVREPLLAQVRLLLDSPETSSILKSRGIDSAPPGGSSETNIYDGRAGQGSARLVSEHRGHHASAGACLPGRVSGRKIKHVLGTAVSWNAFESAQPQLAGTSAVICRTL